MAYGYNMVRSTPKHPNDCKYSRRDNLHRALVLFSDISSSKMARKALVYSDLHGITLLPITLSAFIFPAPYLSLRLLTIC